MTAISFHKRFFLFRNRFYSYIPIFRTDKNKGIFKVNTDYVGFKFGIHNEIWRKNYWYQSWYSIRVPLYKFWLTSKILFEMLDQCNYKNFYIDLKCNFEIMLKTNDIQCEHH